MLTDMKSSRADFNRNFILLFHLSGYIRHTGASSDVYDSSSIWNPWPNCDILLQTTPCERHPAWVTLTVPNYTSSVPQLRALGPQFFYIYYWWGFFCSWRRTLGKTKGYLYMCKPATSGCISSDLLFCFCCQRNNCHTIDI